MSQRFRTLRDLGRAATPAASRLLNGTRTLRSGLEFLSTRVEFIQGRGSGWGWDHRGEALAAARFLRGVEHPVIFDVGANYGQWAAGMTAALGDRPHRMYLFEPQAACHATLAAQASAHRVLVPAGLGAEPGSAPLHTATPGWSRASFYAQRDGDGADLTRHSDSVDVRTVDQEMARLGLDHIDLMKIDVEGAEREVLHGARAALSSGRITTLTFEFGAPNLESRTFFRDFWQVLCPAGYAIWRICPGGVLFPVTAYQERLEHFSSVSNYIASLRRD
ncbi:FkbM family methyltransferase [Streptomyces monticola]|uniref:FkbM family methyltransferase n=1 Tax=Streptomyces monticola TaxID=2666263 RepID=A0ABW2JEB1_9ACTN